MNKLPKCYPLNSLKASIKLSHLMLVQRMSVNSNNIIYTVNEHSICTSKNVGDSEIVLAESSLQTEIHKESVSYNNVDYITVPHTPHSYSYSANFRYYPFYSSIHCKFPIHNSINKSHQFRHYFHGGQNKRNSTLKRNFGEKIMSSRNWEKNSEKPAIKPGFFFTLMSYNVLAQDLLEQHPYLYKNHDTQSLAWPYRWNNLYKEISRFQPDILCLQEVQESHLSDYYSALETLGYQVIYKKRTGYQTDGCAIYYKTNNITLIEYNIVEYYRPSVEVLNRDNVGIITKFAPKLHPTREFIVANTHLLYNPRRDDVRMAQVQLLLTDIENMSFKKDEESYHYLPVIITGDFNSPPYSQIYQFVTNGKISYEQLSPKLLEQHRGSNPKILVTSSLGITDNCQHERVLEKRKSENFIMKPEETKLMSCSANEAFSKQQTDNTVCKNGGMLTHNFAFKSVYNHGGPEMDEGTTYQDKWLTVDYIFYSVKKGDKQEEEKLKLVARYRLPRSQELEDSRIPNKVLGSDHLCLIAKFKLEF